MSGIKQVPNKSLFVECKCSFTWPRSAEHLLCSRRGQHIVNEIDKNPCPQPAPFSSLSFHPSHSILSTEARPHRMNILVLSKNSFLWKFCQSQPLHIVLRLPFRMKPKKECVMGLRNVTYITTWVCKNKLYLVYTILASFVSPYFLDRGRNTIN